jgi:hypothetical protein
MIKPKPSSLDIGLKLRRRYSVLQIEEPKLTSQLSSKVLRLLRRRCELDETVPADVSRVETIT